MPRPVSPPPHRRRHAGWLPGGLAAVTESASADSCLMDMPLDELLQTEISTASKFPQPASQAPSAVAVITAEDIRIHGWRTLTDALLSLPGTYAINDRGYSFLGARGFLVPGDLNTRFLLLVDGIRINDNIYEQAMFGSEFPVDMDLVERIEYVPGPGSSIYGANAMFGVVNVITRPAAELAGSRASVRAGSDGERRGRFSWGGTDEAGNSLLLSGSASYWPGRNRTYPDAANLRLSPGGVAHDLDRSHLGSLFWRANVQGWIFEGLWRDRTVHPSSALYGALFDDPRLRLQDQGFYASLSKETEVADGISVFGQVQLGDMRYNGDYPYGDGTGGSYLNSDRTHGRWWNGELRLNVSRFAGHHFIAGLEWQQDLIARQRNFDDPLQPTSASILADQLQRRWGLYLQDEWRLTDSFRLNLGLRHDHFSLPQSSTSPRVAAIWQPSQGTTLKLLAGRAFRPANAYERDYANGVDYLADPSLRPETIRTTELAWKQQLREQTRLPPSLFRYRLDNLIAQLTDNSGAFIFQNLNSVSASGIEMAADHRFAGGARLRGSLAGQRVTNADGSRFTNSPSRVAKFRAKLPLAGKHWTFAWETQFVGARRYEWNGLPLQVGNQAVSHAALTGKRLAPGLDVSIAVRNVFNRRLSDPAAPDTPLPQVPQDGRIFLVKVDYAL